MMGGGVIVDREEILAKAVDSLAKSVFRLRFFIGMLGVALPIICLILEKVDGRVMPTISHHYYTLSHGVFVSTLAALGACLISYKGVDEFDDRFACFVQRNGPRFESGRLLHH